MLVESLIDEYCGGRDMSTLGTKCPGRQDQTSDDASPKETSA